MEISYSDLPWSVKLAVWGGIVSFFYYAFLFVYFLYALALG